MMAYASCEQTYIKYTCTPASSHYYIASKESFFTGISHAPNLSPPEIIYFVGVGRGGSLALAALISYIDKNEGDVR